MQPSKTMKNTQIRHRNPYLFIVIGYLITILLGSGLLVLPISTHNGVAYVDALFVSTSAVCITGLSSVQLATTFTPFGKVMIALLVQVGGLGFTTVMLAFFSIVKGKINVSDKFLVHETLGNSAKVNFRQMLSRAILITAIVEFIGFCINLIALSTTFSGWQLVGYSLFHAISAFNNAGFDIFGPNSLIDYSTNTLFLLNLSFLTIIGGLGFLVINDVITGRRIKKWSIHTRVVLLMTAVLLLLGTLGLFFSEWGKIDFLNAFFMSAMARTCGFSSQNLANWNNASVLLVDFLMLIGAGPGSTGGGIKVTTFFILLASTVGFFRGKPTVFCHRRIGMELIVRSMRLTIFALLCIFCMGTIVCAIEPQAGMNAVFLEVISAFCNVGFSMNLTPTLGTASKLLICLAMYIGRLNFLTVLMLFRRRWNRGDDESIRYVEAEILIG